MQTTLTNPLTKKITFSFRDCQQAGKDLMMLKKSWISYNGGKGTSIEEITRLRNSGKKG